MLIRIWQKNQTVLRSIARRILNDHALIDDVMQDSLLRLLRYRPPDIYCFEDYPLIRRVVWTTAIDHYRKRQSFPDCPPTPSVNPTPLDRLLELEIQRQRKVVVKDLGRAMDELPRVLRAAVVAYFLRENKAIHRISKDLGLPVSTLRSRAKKGISLLRARLLDERAGPNIRLLRELSTRGGPAA